MKGGEKALVAKPYITALIDTYNHESFIEQAVTSVLEQDFPPSEMEILAVDDGSADGTAAILRKFAPRVRYLHKTNGGQASAFNAGIPQAQGEIVAFLDGDDWWVKSKLSKVSEAMTRDATVGIVGHGITQVYPDGRRHTEVIRETPRFRANSISGARTFRLRKSFLGTSRMTIRTPLLRKILPAPESLRIEADEYLFSLAAVLSDVEILPEPLTYYRIHGSNLFQLPASESAKRRKYGVLMALVESLSEKLRAYQVDAATIRTITEAIQVEADQLGLILDGGYPWETAQTEWKLYRIMHERVSLPYRVFKSLSLMPALVLPPRLFYHWRQRLVRNEAYLRARQKWIPIPQPGHVERSWSMGSEHSEP